MYPIKRKLKSAIYEFKKIIFEARIVYSSSFAMKTANDFWSNTTITHGNMDESSFDFYYFELTKVLSQKKEDLILDYGGGNGEIAHRFQKNGFNIRHCDINATMIKNAKDVYNLDSYHCNELKNVKFNIIFCSGVFYYIHPSLYKKVIQKIYDSLEVNGKFYIADSPDFDKREKSGDGQLIKKFLPLYQPEMAGFFLKTNQLKSIAKSIGFTFERIDSWCDYRSHWIFTKTDKH